MLSYRLPPVIAMPSYVPSWQQACELSEQRRRAEEEAGVAVIDVVLDDLGVEHSHSHQGGVDHPIRGESGLRAAPHADGEMRAHMEAQEGGGGRAWPRLRRPGMDRPSAPAVMVTRSCRAYSPSTLAISSTWARSTLSTPPLGVSVSAP